MSATSVRAVARSTRFISRLQARSASTTADVANAASSGAAKAKETAGNVASQASQGLSKVTSSAGSSLSKAGAAASGAVSGVGGRAGRLISLVQCRLGAVEDGVSQPEDEPTVAFELELRLTDRSSAQIQQYYQRFLSAVRNPSSLVKSAPSMTNPQQALNSIRNINRQQAATVGIVAAEVLGFFTVGEMIGRLKLVGYRGKVEHH